MATQLSVSEEDTVCKTCGIVFESEEDEEETDSEEPAPPKISTEFVSEGKVGLLSLPESGDDPFHTTDYSTFYTTKTPEAVLMNAHNHALKTSNTNMRKYLSGLLGFDKGGLESRVEESTESRAHKKPQIKKDDKYLIEADQTVRPHQLSENQQLSDFNVHTSRPELLNAYRIFCVKGNSVSATYFRDLLKSQDDVAKQQQLDTTKTPGDYFTEMIDAAKSGDTKTAVDIYQRNILATSKNAALKLLRSNYAGWSESFAEAHNLATFIGRLEALQK